MVCNLHGSIKLLRSLPRQLEKLERFPGTRRGVACLRSQGKMFAVFSLIRVEALADGVAVAKARAMFSLGRGPYRSTLTSGWPSNLILSRFSPETFVISPMQRFRNASWLQWLQWALLRSVPAPVGHPSFGVRDGRHAQRALEQHMRERV
jgi:hypothetical protein